MAHLHESTQKTIVKMLEREKRKLEANLSMTSANIRVKMHQEAHKTIGDHAPDCTSNLPSMTLSHIIPNLINRIKKIKQTIKRVQETSEYGTCLTCGEEIPIARLMHVPFVEQCVVCKGEQEQKDRRRNIGRIKNLIYL